MIKNVKSYFQTVAYRLSNAFRLESFEVEDELEFWALSAEYLSQKGTPSFVDIVDWIDRLYQAPVHFIYKAEKDDKLILFKRHIISENVIQDAGEVLEEITSKQKSKLIAKLENQLQNLEHKISFHEDYKSIGLSTFSIGQCEHIPLFKDSEFWGIYCLGPYVQSPEAIIPKFSIISRILTKWLIELDSKEKDNRLEQNVPLVEKIEGFGSGELNITEVSSLLLRHVVESVEASYGLLIHGQDGNPGILTDYISDKASVKPLSDIPVSELLTETDGSYSLSKKSKEDLDREGFEDYKIIQVSAQSVIVLLYKKSPGRSHNPAKGDLEYIIDTQQALIRYQKQSEEISDRLIETYYRMLRILEKKRDKTAWHTPRMLALADKFSDLFGLDESEKKDLLLTAKLHDIGYVGSIYINKKMTVGTEIEHPLLGGMMVQQLPLSKQVKEGIRTHHEWVNGSGTPKQLEEEEIPWTGKIIGVFEFIVEFIENHHDDDSKTDDEWLDQLIEDLADRTEKQFDLVLIPTFVELLKSLGWKKCCELGAE